MSRVHRPRDKYVNTCKYPPSVTNVKVLPIETNDYKSAKTLTEWLRLKYGTRYSSYRSKSKERRNQLRCEYEEDTGNKLENT